MSHSPAPEATGQVLQTTQLKLLVPVCTNLPSKLLQLTGSNGSHANIVFFAAGERRTSQSLMGKFKPAILLMTHTTIFILDSQGLITRVNRLTDMQNLVSRCGPTSAITHVILRFESGDPDLLFHFMGPNTSSSEAAKLAREINRPADSTGAVFLQRLKILHDAFQPSNKLQIVEVAPNRLDAAADLQRKPGGKDVDAKLKKIEHQVSACLTAPTPVATVEVPDPDHPGEGGDADNPSGEHSTVVQQLQAEELRKLRAQNAELQRQVDSFDMEKRQMEDELLRLHEERGNLVEQQQTLQARVDDLTESSLNGRASADDFSRIAHQLLHVQKQLLMERQERQALIDQEVEKTETIYDKIVVRQQDEIDQYRVRLERLERVFAQTKFNIARQNDDDGASTAAQAQRGTEGLSATFDQMLTNPQMYGLGSGGTPQDDPTQSTAAAASHHHQFAPSASVLAQHANRQGKDGRALAKLGKSNLRYALLLDT